MQVSFHYLPQWGASSSPALQADRIDTHKRKPSLVDSRDNRQESSVLLPIELFTVLGGEFSYHFRGKAKFNNSLLHFCQQCLWTRPLCSLSLSSNLSNEKEIGNISVMPIVLCFTHTVLLICRQPSILLSATKCLQAVGINRIKSVIQRGRQGKRPRRCLAQSK